MLFGNSLKKKVKQVLYAWFLAQAAIQTCDTAYAIDREPTGLVPPFVLLTVPKSGSHMVIKALYLMTGATPIWHTKFPSFYYIPSNEGFLYTHLCISPVLERDYADLPKLKKIINIRDLRDVCVSIIHQIRKDPWPGMSGMQREAFLQSSFDEQLQFVIDFDYDPQEVAREAPNSLQVSLAKIAEQSIRLSQDEKNLVCRYEDLVGSMGGGSDDAQMEALSRIAQFLELPLTRMALSEIARQLYGDQVNPFGKSDGFEQYRSTFKHGKIGSWKSSFNEKHKAAFKKKFGSALIALGYETDENW